MLSGASLACCLLLCGLVASQSAPGEIRYILTEEVESGHIIGNIVQDAMLDKKYQDRILRKLRFRFLTQVHTGFMIEEETGILKTEGRVDRDSICPRQNMCEVKLDIAVKPVQYFQIIKVAIEIFDINDNEPTFTEPKVSHQILESASPGASFVLPNAIDEDSPQYGIMGYELDSDTRKFDFQVTERVDGSTDVRLILKEKLDREKESEYKVSVIAYDGGSPPKSGSVDISITVIDANDNDPVFQHKVYEVSVPESAPAGTTVVKVHAVDPDAGKNGQIVYSFSDRTLESYGQVFAIDEHTGAITVKGEMDYESATVYHLAVVAKDQGPDSLPADATVIVRVEDINDHAPEITVNTLSEEGGDVAEVSENADIGTFLAHITVKDKDKGRNGEFGCSLNDGNFELIRSYSSEYKIVTARKLDREDQSEYDMQLLCEDKGIDSQVEVKNIKVKILDANDHRPRFEKAEYTSNLLENNFVGAYVTQVNASDGDIGNNALIRYSVAKEVSALFNIDPKSGVITAASSFDREEMDHISFYVIASDQGEPPKSGSALVHVTIMDVNDEPPRFVESKYSFEVFENEPVGTEVGYVSAIDKDASPHDGFDYSIIRSRSDVDSFTIDPNTGRITTKNVLNREDESIYYLLVAAKDDGRPPLSSTVSVSIQVGDRNDWSPTFDYPTAYNSSVFLSNQVPMGYPVAHIMAHDEDIGINAKIKFTIIAGNEADMFDLDPLTGKMITIGDFTQVEHELFDLTIKAQDLGNPPQSAEAVLSVLVNKTVGFAYGSTPNLGGIFGIHSFLIIISLAVGSGVITIILIIAIICIRRKERRKNDHGKYNCRMEAMKVMNAKEKEIEKANQKLKKARLANGELSMEQSLDVLTPINGKQDTGFMLEKEHAAFIEDIQRSRSGSGHSWPSEGESPNQVTAALLPGSSPVPRDVAAPAPRHKAAPAGKAWGGQKDMMEVHQLLELLKTDADTDSAYSGDGTDSGRGGSEEGEGGHNAAQGPLTDVHMPPSIAEETSSVSLTPTPSAHSYTSGKAQELRTFSPNNTYRRLGEDPLPPPPLDDRPANANNHNNDSKQPTTAAGNIHSAALLSPRLRNHKQMDTTSPVCRNDGSPLSAGTYEKLLEKVHSDNVEDAASVDPVQLCNEIDELFFNGGEGGQRNGQQQQSPPRVVAPTGPTC